MAEQVIGDALPSEITADYDVGQTLGTGHFSKVKLGTDKKTGEKVAIKVCVSSAVRPQPECIGMNARRPVAAQSDLLLAAGALDPRRTSCCCQICWRCLPVLV